MSCFRGQMNEYSSIAIDRFDGKNLQCTAFFLSHCHKDHMVGLNSPYFLDCLSSRDNIFLYCSEITRLLLLADEEYSALEKYTRTLDVGVPQPVRIPSNSICKTEQYVNVTLISAGHCPGSVMFLFEGSEGTSLYTGDFRWEVGQASKVAYFKQDDRPKKIKSIYVDTTFCIPEAYHIPSRNECVEATLTLVSDWLQRSPSHVVSLSCPARFGHEHLLVELAQRLDCKIHVPEWKVRIYEQISHLEGLFTADTSKARIHACSIRMSHSSFLPCKPPGRGEGKHYKLLKIRPSTMWFTSEKSRCRTEDLVVAPVSQRGLHRVCYSMHSSYREIRDLVSFLQPKYVLPNVLPMQDNTMDSVQKRLNSFLNFPNKQRLESVASKDSLRPLGTLKKISPICPTTEQPPSAESSDDLVFSSQETSPKKFLTGGRATSREKQSPLRADSKQPVGLWKDTSLQLSSKESLKSSSTKSHSSYSGSDSDGEGLNLFSDEEEENEKEEANKGRGEGDLRSVAEDQNDVCNDDKEEEEESFRLYISGDSDISDDENDSELDSENELIDADNEKSTSSSKTMQSAACAVTTDEMNAVKAKNGRPTTYSNINCDSNCSVSPKVNQMQTKTEYSRNVEEEDKSVRCINENNDTECAKVSTDSNRCPSRTYWHTSNATSNVKDKSEEVTKNENADDNGGKAHVDNDDDDDDDKEEEDLDDDSDIIPNSQESSYQTFKLFSKGKVNINSSFHKCDRKSDVPAQNTENERKNDGTSKNDSQTEMPMVDTDVSLCKEEVSDSQATIIISSSSDDSQKTQSFESQSFWSNREGAEGMSRNVDKEIKLATSSHTDNETLLSEFSNDSKALPENTDEGPRLGAVNVYQERFEPSTSGLREGKSVDCKLEAPEFSASETVNQEACSLSLKRKMPSCERQEHTVGLSQSESDVCSVKKLRKEVDKELHSSVDRVLVLGDKNGSDCIVIREEDETGMDSVKLEGGDKKEHQTSETSSAGKLSLRGANLTAKNELTPSLCGKHSGNDALYLAVEEHKKSASCDRYGNGDVDSEVMFVFEDRSLESSLVERGWTSKQMQLKRMKGLSNTPPPSNLRKGQSKYTSKHGKSRKQGDNRHRVEEVDLTKENQDNVVDLTLEN